MSELRMHLTDEQMDDVLIGDASAEAAAHLKACPACAARMAAATMPMASFKAVSAAWSERRSATMPAIVPQRAGLGARGRMMAWSAALSAMIVAGIAVPVFLHQQQDAAAGRGVQAAPVVAAQATTGVTAESGPTGVETVAYSAKPVGPSAGQQAVQEDIVRDNAMLLDIDRELDATNATPAVLTLESPHGPLAKPQTVNE